MIKCRICNKEYKDRRSIAGHIRQTHKLKSKEYYDKYLKKEGEGICECGKKTKFADLNRGYCKYCSVKCVNNSDSFKNNIKTSHLNRSEEKIKESNKKRRRTFSEKSDKEKLEI